MKLINRTLSLAAIFLCFINGAPALAQNAAPSAPETASTATDSARRWWIQSEIGGVWQTKNNVQIPADTGTRFSLVDVGGSGPALAGRIYLGYRLSERHELRALYAPLKLKLSGEPETAINFQNETFAAGVTTDATYVFNSYRLTYRYLFFDEDRWKLRVGFTGKIRDAEIRLAQGGVSATRSNVGFVPLLHFSAIYSWSPKVNVHFDVDALAAKQGRAEDVALLVGYRHNDQLEFLGGYRTVEGGADGGGDVYNFSWFHYAVAGLIYRL